MDTHLNKETGFVITEIRSSRKKSHQASSDSGSTKTCDSSSSSSSPSSAFKSMKATRPVSRTSSERFDEECEKLMEVLLPSNVRERKYDNCFQRQVPAKTNVEVRKFYE